MTELIGVYYRGSQTDHHGLYWAEKEGNRYALYRGMEDTHPVLRNVRNESFDLMVMVAENGTLVRVVIWR